MLDKDHHLRHGNATWFSGAAMMTYSGGALASRQFRRGRVIWPSMSSSCSRFFAAFLGAAMVIAAVSAAQAQAPAEQKPQEQGQKPPGTPPTDAGKEEKKKVDEFAEAARMLTGPAGNPECVWLGRRVVSLLWRDDLDTALRQLELYDRFGCPGDHLQQTFRCVVRQGEIDKKSPESIGVRVQACWINPTLPPVIAAPAVGAPSAPSSQ
jgi:hypothetical protein